MRNSTVRVDTQAQPEKEDEEVVVWVNFIMNVGEIYVLGIASKVTTIPG